MLSLELTHASLLDDIGGKIAGLKHPHSLYNHHFKPPNMAYCNPLISVEYAVSLHGLKPPHRAAMVLEGLP